MKHQGARGPHDGRRRPRGERRAVGSGEEGIRCFVALCLPEGVLDALEEVTAWGKRENPRIRWVKRRHIHCTLVFMGDIPPLEIPNVADKFCHALSETRAFHLELGKPGQFPVRGQTRVLWWGIPAQDDALGCLAQTVRDCAAELGHLPDKKPFRAHLTLARVRDRNRGSIHWPPPRAVWPSSESFAVRNVTLFSSQLRSEGPVHTPVATYNLIHE